MSVAARRVVVSTAFALAAFVVALTWRGYGLDLSVATGAAFGLLAFVTLRTVERMRHTLRR